MPKADYWDLNLPEHHICLLTDDGSLVTSQLAYSLTREGVKVVVLSFPESLMAEQSSLPKGVARVMLTDMSEAHLQEQLEKITRNYGSIGAFIHLHPVFPISQNHSIGFLETDKAIVKQVFLLAKYLKKSLNQSINQGNTYFLTVTRLDGELGIGQKMNQNPIPGGLFGLTKSLNQEWKSVFCRAIDLSPKLTFDEMCHGILAELHDPNPCLTEVGYGHGGRSTLTLLA